MNQIHYFVLLGCLLLAATACDSYQIEKENLQEASYVVDENPQAALRLLAGIGDPQKLDWESYMQYVVTLTQAKYMDYQDITQDTLIFEAVKYFEATKNPEWVARAYFYAASLCSEEGEKDESLMYFLKSNHYAQQAGNKLFIAKSSNNIGNAYSNEQMPDIALRYYEQAQEIFGQVAYGTPNHINAIFSLGVTYLELGKENQALICYVQGLDFSRKSEDEAMEAQLLRNIGIYYRRQKEYTQAKNYFNQALTKKQENSDVLRTYLSLARTYRATNKPDSVKFYLDLVQNELATITSPITRSDIYEELISYYEEKGSAAEVKRYYNLLLTEEKKIQTTQKEEKIQTILYKFEQFKQDVKIKQSRTVEIGITSLAIVLFVLGNIWYQLRDNKKIVMKTRTQLVFQEWNQVEMAVQSYQGIAEDEEALLKEIQERYPELCVRSISDFFSNQRARINKLFAQWGRLELKEYPKGKNALMQLNIQDLCILHLCHLSYSDADIARMLGYIQSEGFLQSRKKYIQQVLADAGMSEREQNSLIYPNK